MFAEAWAFIQEGLLYLFQGFLLYGAALSFGITVVLFILLSYVVKPDVPEEDRAFMDPLPWSLRIIWVPVLILSYYITSNFPHRVLDSTDDKLQKSGLSYLITAEQFFAIRIIIPILSILVAGYLMAMLGEWEPQVLGVGLVIGLLLPQVWLQDTRKRRAKKVIRSLPVYLDFITMAVEAGLNLSGAIQQAMDKGPKGPMRNEFAIVLRDLRSGLTRAESLKRMAERLEIKEVSNFVNAMVQAERMGSSMAATLRVQSEQRRNERFQRAEKMAMEAPVKLVFPLIVFIFPVTFIILGFPIVMKFLNEGIF